jgi:cytochrome c oxidase subunit II
MRRRVLLLGAAAAGWGVRAQDGPREIALVARRFVFEPAEVRLKAGEKVVIAIRSLDFFHGLNVPALGRRIDLIPNRVVRLELEPTVPGVIDFLCDNFCGEGHEEMHGRFVVGA